MSAWWPLADVVGVAGDHSLHAVDAWGEPRNADHRRPFVARCGVVVWTIYAVDARDTAGGTGVLALAWPPRLAVARRGFDGAIACPDCRRQSPRKRPSPTWDHVA